MHLLRFFFLLLLLLAVLRITSDADIVYLKNGKQIECKTAWEEGKQVKYTIANGTVGIPKSIVAKIVKTEPKLESPNVPEQFKQKAPHSLSKQTQKIETPTKSDPSNPTVKRQLADEYTNLGISMVDRKDFTGALESFQKAHRYIKDEETTFNLALMYFVLEDHWNAELYFNELLKINPKSTEALNYLGEISWKKEDLSAAQSYWQTSVAIKSDPAIQIKLQSLRKEKSASANFENASSRHFLIKYDGGEADQRLVREISESMEEIYQQLSSQYEIYPPDPFIVVLYPRQQFFRVMDLPLWSAGANDGKIKLPIKGLSSVNTEMRNVLVHELSHSFVDFKTSRNCPAWLQEGLAQYTEGKRSSQEGLETLAQLISSNQLPSISKLTAGFSGNNADVAAILYLQSLSFVEYLLERYQFYQMNELLEQLGKMVSVSEAFGNAYLAPLSEVESDWRKQLIGE